MNFTAIKKEAELSIAKTALANPFMFNEAVELSDARVAAEEAQKRLTKAENAWKDLIAPAFGWAQDPLKK